MQKLKFLLILKGCYLQYLSCEITFNWFDLLVSEIYSILQRVYTAYTDTWQPKDHDRASTLQEAKITNNLFLMHFFLLE